jgi:hypothetical protein
MELGALLRNFFAKRAARRSHEDGRPARPFRFDWRWAETRPKRNAHFALRNETFRKALRKPLKSLWAPNQAFLVIVCFQ